MTLALRDITTQIQNAPAHELVKIDAHLETLEHHARKVKDNTGKLREIVILRIEVLRKLGAWLNENAPHGGPRLPGANLDITLERMGISPKLSTRARKLAEIHEEDVRVFIAESGDEINVTHLLRLHTESETAPPAWDDDAAKKLIISALQDYSDNGTDDWWVECVNVFLSTMVGGAK